jgi:3-deoxy-manno-octulosonate cytidylyltransferase (CMP-KDO synthetase)
VRRASCVTRVAIATDDQRIYDAARGFGAEVFMTDPAHPSGTDRVAEVAAKLDASIVVNVQGDEPFLDPAAIELAVKPMLHGDVNMSTLKTPFRDSAEAADPNVVKVVTDLHGNALYFSRLPIPLVRDKNEPRHYTWFKHLGLYVYERGFLLRYPSLRRGPLEAAEKLEQLRALENGYPIRVVETASDSVGIDTQEDLDKARALRAANGS